MDSAKILLLTDQARHRCINRQTECDRQTDRQTDGQIECDRQADGQTECHLDSGAFTTQRSLKIKKR